jgi:hypothetical protein
LLEHMDTGVGEQMVSIPLIAKATPVMHTAEQTRSAWLHFQGKNQAKPNTASESDPGPGSVSGTDPGSGFGSGSGSGSASPALAPTTTRTALLRLATALRLQTGTMRMATRRR